MAERAVDIVVAGAGPVGLGLAASLAGTGLRIALVDPQSEAALATPGDDGREIALTDRSVATLRVLGAWERIPPSAIAPLRRMRVLNGPSDYAMRLGGGDMLGRFAPNHWLRRSLHDVVRALPDVTLLTGTAITAVEAGARGTVARLADGRTIAASLAVAADTRRSRLRAQQGIGAALHDYRQRMVVCPVSHPMPHEATATAWFEYGQTLVTLPMNAHADHGNMSSAVMTLGEDDAGALLALDDEQFGRAVTRRYHGRLGPMRPVGRRHAVPVVTAYAHRFVAPRFALLGDAAVGMHPTTAHGFNFGLLGVDALAGALRAGIAGGHDVGDAAALARYEAAHRAETRLFFTGAEALMRLYAAGGSLPARLLRDAALRLGNLPPVRAALAARMRDPEAGRPV